MDLLPRMSSKIGSSTSLESTSMTMPIRNGPTMIPIMITSSPGRSGSSLHMDTWKVRISFCIHRHYIIDE